ncbi:MAG: FAD-dependent oxidoreductase [Ilumatobacteraceae bacterium]
MSAGTAVVVGAGLSGLRAAEALRRHGHTGRVVLVGEEVHLPYDRPPMSKDVLVSVDEPAPAWLSSPERLDEINVETLLGVATTSLDTDLRRLRLDDGSELPFDQLVIATGVRPRTLPQLGSAPEVVVLRTWADAVALRASLRDAEHVTVVGGGVLGAEIAASTRSTGSQVTLVEAADSLLAVALPSQLGEAVTSLHRRHGVDVRLGVSARAVAAADGRRSVELSDGTSHSTDVIVLAIGSLTNTEWLDGSGVVVDDGVVTDHFGLTSIDGIAAVGDVARVGGRAEGPRREHWTRAADGTDPVVANLLTAPADRVAVTDVPYFWSDQFGLKIQGLGAYRASDDIQVVAGSLDDTWLAVHSRDGVVTGATGAGMTAGINRCRAAVTQGLPLADLMADAPWTRVRARPGR